MKLFKSNHNYFPTHKSSPIIDTPFGNILMELKVGDYNFSNTYTDPECLRLSKGGTLLSYSHNKFIAELVIFEPAYNIPNHMDVDKVYAGVWKISQIHFVVAWNNTIDENDVSTWFTVEMSGDEILSKEGLK